MAVAELLSHIKQLAQDFQYLSPSECCSVTDGLLERLEGAELPPDACKAVLTFALSVVALRCPGHRPLQWSCLALVTAAGKSAKAMAADSAANTADVHSFFLKLGKKEVKAQTTWKPRVLVTLLQNMLRWAQVTNLHKALTAEGEGAVKPELLTGLMEALYLEMNRCERWSSRWQVKAAQSLGQLFKALPSLPEHAATWAGKREDVPALLAAGLSAEVAPQAGSPMRSSLVDLYSKQVLEAKQPLSDYALECWAPLIATMTKEELEKLLPLALRMSKRNAAVVAHALPVLASHLKVDASPLAAQFLEPLAVEMIKDKDRRQKGCRLMTAVAKASVDPSGALAVGDTWAEALKKAGKTDEKQALLMAIAALASGLTKAAAEGAAKLADAKGGVGKACEDANEDTRAMACKAMGNLALLLEPPAQDKPVQELAKTLADKKAPPKAVLAALEALAEIAGAVGQEAGAPSWAKGVLEKSLPLLTVAATKPVQRHQSLLAWAACGSLASKDKEALGALLKKEHLAILKDGTSFANTVALILKAPASELVSQAQLWKAVLAGHIGNLQAPGAAARSLLEEGAGLKVPPSNFADVLPWARTTIVVLAALHEGRSAGSRPQPKPRERLGLLEACAGHSAPDAKDMLLLLCHGFVAWLAQLQPMAPSQRNITSGALRGALLDLCYAAGSREGICHPETLALLCVAAHHPLVASLKWPVAKHWSWLCGKGPLAAPMDAAPSTVWPVVRKLLSAARVLPANEPSGFRKAALNMASAFDLGAVSGAGKSAVEDCVSGIIQECITAMHSEEVEKENPANIPIYFAEEGKLWVEEGTYKAEEVEDKNPKQNKFLKALYGDDAMDIQREVAKPAAPKAKGKAGAASGKAKAKAKAGASGANMTQSDIEQARIQEQSEDRERIRKFVDEAAFALDVLAALAALEENASVLEEAMPLLMQHLMKLLKSPLTVLKARECARALAISTVQKRFVTRREMLPDALMVAVKGWLSRSSKQAGTPGDTPACEILLESVEMKRPMPAAALSMVLPIMLHTLRDGNPSLDTVCLRSLQLLERQLSIGAEVPEALVKEVFDSLGIALLALPSQRQATQAAMLAVGKYLVATEDQLQCLADMFFAEEELVRGAVIAALAESKNNTLIADGTLDPSPMRAVLRLGTLESGTEEAAKTTLEELELEADEVLLMELIEFASTKPNLCEAVQLLIAKSVAEVLGELADPKMSMTALDLLTQRFREDANSRIAVARCLERVMAAGLEGEEQVIKAFRFLLRQGLGLTSGETKEASALREVLLAAGMGLIEKHGEEHSDVLFETVEDFEDSGVGAAAGESARLGVAVFLGGLSKHLGADNPKVPEILPRLLQRLLDTTSTPSVQNAIVKVMPPLMKLNKEQAVETLEKLMDQALAPKTNEVTRRGAAMGLGATVKGLSIQAVSQHQILKRIEAAAEDKKESKVRQGALLCLEGLTLSLGRLFDPYVVSSLPLLLQAFSDGNADVRTASKNASGVMMSQLSGPGVKQVLNPLLEGIQDKQWRTKLGSIELLSAMTNCLPKQLAACLPKVVPALCGVINDQHAKVKEAARDALNKIGSIITSPELKNLAPELIEALTEGAQYEYITMGVLDKLLSTSFVHHIDAPSLSLVCPLVQRALKERAAEMKRKGAQIVGSMVLLIKDAKDIQPYLPLLLPQLKVILVDPIPDVRATSAKAFGTLAKELPEEMLGDVLPWLFNMLRSPESAVERSGAAHGLSEVLMAMGEERIEKLLPDILANARNKDAPPEVKEGYLGLFVYLPVAMGQGFEPYIEEILVALLNGMSDDTSSVRDTAFRAAQVIVKQFGASHTARLLPPMEDGVFNTDWRIRHASVQLMGQLIEHILRANRVPTNSAELMHCEFLPKEWRHNMLASLYIVRSDENGVVKQACAQVWKAVVQNTPRTLKDLLPALMTRLIDHLASSNREKQRVAARCVGDLVGKLAERVMPELMPIFMNTLSTGDPHVREGVCIGLAELINATTKQLLADYLADLIPAIRQAIIDDSETVRNSASNVVALLNNAVGPRATSDVVTWVLAQLKEDHDEEYGHLFINGLEKLLAKQPGAVLPIVLGKLTAKSDDGFTKLQLQGLSALAVIPDSHTVHRHLSDVLPVMISVASDADAEEDLRESALDSATRVMERVEQGGLNLLFTELISAAKDQSSATRRAAGIRLFERFFDRTSLDVVSILSMALPAVLPPALADSDPETLASGVKALNAIVKKCKKEELASFLNEVRDTILKLISDPETKRVDPTKLLPGLCQHNGLEPLYPIYQQGLMFGSAEARELAARGLGELVDHTSEEALKPYVVRITGPLIRIVGDRFPGTVKKAIVDTLKSLLIRGGATLKPFLPQLQTTYVRCLQDPSEAVRQKAAESLGTLVRLSARTEPLIKELATGAATHADPAVKLAMCTALGEVLANVPQPAGAETQEKVEEAVLPRALGGDAEQRDIEVAGWVLGTMIRRHAPAEKAVELLKEHVLLALEDEEDSIRLGGAYALAGACWSQTPQTPKPEDELLECLKEITSEWLPKLLCDAEASVTAAGVVLYASVAWLHSVAGLPWDLLTSHADRFLALVVPNQAPSRIALHAIRHVAAAASAAGQAVPLAPKLAAAVAAEGGGEAPEEGERAMSALLLASGGQGGQAEAKAAVEKLQSGLEGKAATILKDFAPKRLRLFVQQYADKDFSWDF